MLYIKYGSIQFFSHIFSPSSVVVLEFFPGIQAAGMTTEDAGEAGCLSGRDQAVHEFFQLIQDSVMMHIEHLRSQLYVSAAGQVAVQDFLQI